MLDKKEKKKAEPIDFSNPYNWWGFGLLMIGVLFGGAIGGGTGAIVGYAIMAVGKKKMSHIKKIGICLLITIGGVFVFFTLASIIMSFFPKK
jgi:hypothetical protein